jgi:hypothetical protein
MEFRPMKVLLIAAVAAVIGAGSAFAQGLPPGQSAPVYGTHAFPNQPYQDKTVFSQLFERFNTHHDNTVRRADISARTGQGS